MSKLEEGPVVAEEACDLETEIQLEVPPTKISHTLLEMLYDGSVPVAGGVDISDIRQEGCGWILLTIYMISFVALFFYFTYTGTSENYHTKFLAIEKGENDVCAEVPLTITATYKGDIFGNWETNSNEFLYNSSIFIVDFVGSRITNSQYSTVMTGFKNQLHNFGVKSRSRNVIWSLLVWTTLSLSNSNVAFTSSTNIASYIGESITGFWSSRNGLCTTSKPITGKFNPITSRFHLSVPQTSSLCVNQSGGLMKLLSPYYYATPSDSAFEIEIDTRSIQTVIALNFRIRDLSQLNIVKPEFHEYVSGLYPGKFYIDPSYASMQPIFCVNKRASVYNLTSKAIAGPEICFLVDGDNGVNDIVFSYPMIGHFKNPYLGLNTTTSQFGPTGYLNACECPADKHNEDCNTIGGLVYTIIYSESSSNVMNNSLHDIFAIGKKMQNFLVIDSANGEKAIMKYFEPITVYSMVAASNFTAYSNASLRTYTLHGSKGYVNYNYSWAKGESLSKLLRDAWDNICPSKSCGAAIFKTGGSLAGHLFNPMTTHQTQLGYLSNDTFIGKHSKAKFDTVMCTDTFTQSVALNSFIHKAPTSLVQPYYECHFSLGKSFRTAIGNAYSGASLFCNIGITIIGFIVVFFINHIRSVTRKGRQIKKLKDKKLKDYVQAKVGEKTMTSINEALEALTFEVRELKANRQHASLAGEQDALRRKNNFDALANEIRELRQNRLSASVPPDPDTSKKDEECKIPPDESSRKRSISLPRVDFRNPKSDL